MATILWEKGDTFTFNQDNPEPDCGVVVGDNQAVLIAQSDEIRGGYSFTKGEIPPDALPEKTEKMLFVIQMVIRGIQTVLGEEQKAPS